jgi:hypothetical protein
MNALAIFLILVLFGCCNFMNLDNLGNDVLGSLSGVMPNADRDDLSVPGTPTIIAGKNSPISAPLNMMFCPVPGRRYDENSLL